MKTIKVGDQQLDLFAHDVSTSTPRRCAPRHRQRRPWRRSL
jgi:hypothetical protein